MADTSVFGRLRRLFSTDIIIRNVGGTNIKIADTNQIQATGKYRTNSLMDRYTRLYVNRNLNIYNPNLNYQTLRQQLYSDYEAMDTDPIIASALDIIADEKSVKQTSKQLESLYTKLSERVNKLQDEIGFYHSNETCPTCNQNLETSFKNDKIDQLHKKLHELDSGILEITARVS